MLASVFYFLFLFFLNMIIYYLLLFKPLPFRHSLKKKNLFNSYSLYFYFIFSKFQNFKIKVDFKKNLFEKNKTSFLKSLLCYLLAFHILPLTATNGRISFFQFISLPKYLKSSGTNMQFQNFCLKVLLIAVNTTY